VIAPGQACLIAGTWSVNAVVTSAPIASHRLIFNALNTPATWLTIDASPPSTANLEWFVAQFCAEERAEAHARGVSVYQVCGDLLAARAGRHVDHLPPVLIRLEHPAVRAPDSMAWPAGIPAPTCCARSMRAWCTAT